MQDEKRDGSRGALTLALLLAGCGGEDWRDRIQNYRCTEAQFAEVQKEADYCTKNTEMTAMYCFCAAKISLCDSIGAQPSPSSSPTPFPNLEHP